MLALCFFPCMNVQVTISYEKINRYFPPDEIAFSFFFFLSISIPFRCCWWCHLKDGLIVSPNFDGICGERASKSGLHTIEIKHWTCKTTRRHGWIGALLLQLLFCGVFFFSFSSEITSTFFPHSSRSLSLSFASLSFSFMPKFGVAEKTIGIRTIWCVHGWTKHCMHE